MNDKHQSPKRVSLSPLVERPKKKTKTKQTSMKDFKMTVGALQTSKGNGKRKAVNAVKAAKSSKKAKTKSTKKGASNKATTKTSNKATRMDRKEADPKIPSPKRTVVVSLSDAFKAHSKAAKFSLEGLSTYIKAYFEKEKPLVAANDGPSKALLNSSIDVGVSKGSNTYSTLVFDKKIAKSVVRTLINRYLANKNLTKIAKISSTGAMGFMVILK